MKTAVIILPKIPVTKESEGYLSACANKVIREGYTLLHSTQQYQRIDLPEFIDRASFNIDAFFLFVDYGVSELMTDLVKKYYIHGIFLKEIHVEANRKPDILSLTGIRQKISDMTGVSISAMQGKCRKRELVAARQFYCKYAKDHNKYSLSMIGGMINRDHSTVLHSVKAVNETRELMIEYCDLFDFPYPDWVKSKKPVKIDTPLKAEIMASMPHAPVFEIRPIGGSVHQEHFKGYMEHCMKA